MKGSLKFCELIVNNSKHCPTDNLNHILLRDNGKGLLVIMSIDKHRSENKHIHYSNRQDNASLSDLYVSGGKQLTLKNTLENLRGQSISMTISECNDNIQGRIWRVDEGNLTLLGQYGFHIIPICSISSINPLN